MLETWQRKKEEKKGVGEKKMQNIFRGGNLGLRKQTCAVKPPTDPKKI
jgi:hypothetical protein